MSNSEERERKRIQASQGMVEGLFDENKKMSGYNIQNFNDVNVRKAEKKVRRAEINLLAEKGLRDVQKNGEISEESARELVRKILYGRA